MLGRTFSLGRICCALLPLVACATTQTGAPEPRPPQEVDEASIAAGRNLFHGTGACSSCHGERGVGTPDGPSLTSGDWELGDGTFNWLVHMTQHAGWGTRGRGDDPRAMRGPTGLDQEQVRQVAAYVWSISREKAPAKPGS